MSLRIRITFDYIINYNIGFIREREKHKNYILYKYKNLYRIKSKKAFKQLVVN